MKNKQLGQGLIEYLLIVVLVAIVLFMIGILLFAPIPTTPCDKSKPTAGDIVSCIATRTAEAKNR